MKSLGMAQETKIGAFLPQYIWQNLLVGAENKLPSNLSKH